SDAERGREPLVHPVPRSRHRSPACPRRLRAGGDGRPGRPRPRGTLHRCGPCPHGPGDAGAGAAGRRSVMTRMPRATSPGWLPSSVVALGLALVVGPLGIVRNLGAENWGGLTPGESTRAQVEALYGRPSRERPLTEEGRTVAELTYAADRAPRGLERMVVSFGLMV